MTTPSISFLNAPRPILPMSDDVNDVRWKEFEDLGEEDVRKRLAQHIWSEEKERLAREWLAFRETRLDREANELARKANVAAKEANDLARSANEIANRNNVIATLALIGAVIAIGVSFISLFVRH
jgi:hypothetical protein